MHDEKRQHPRSKQKNRAYVSILSSPEKPSLENRNFSCSTEDVSTGGVQLTLPEAVPVGGTLELRLVMRNPVKTFWHIGRVAWVRRSSPKVYNVGVQFTRTPEATLLIWEELVREKLNRNGARAARAD